LLNRYLKSERKPPQLTEQKTLPLSSKERVLLIVNMT